MLITRLNDIQFLDSSTNLYKRVCPSVGPSVGPSVSPSRVFFKLRKLTNLTNLINLNLQIWQIWQNLTNLSLQFNLSPFLWTHLCSNELISVVCQSVIQCLAISLSLCPHVSLSDRLSVCLYIRLCVSQSTCPNINWNYPHGALIDSQCSENKNKKNILIQASMVPKKAVPFEFLTWKKMELE